LHFVRLGQLHQCANIGYLSYASGRLAVSFTLIVELQFAFSTAADLAQVFVCACSSHVHEALTQFQFQLLIQLTQQRMLLLPTVRLAA
jgi:hypothetical protein